MRAMARCVRRAGLQAKYTQGFHPHIAMSFAQALGVGYLSSGEYMEMELDDSASLVDTANVLNTALPEGIRITGAWRLNDAFPTLMAAVSAARWLVEFNETVDDAFVAKFKALLDRESIEVVKEGRNGPVNMDIRPGIYEINPHPLAPSPEESGRGDVAAATGGIYLLLAAGSKLNVRPELVVRAALGEDARAKAITRLELYTTVNERLTPIEKICEAGDFDERGESHTR
jgi:radical SAM-linked protein